MRKRAMRVAAAICVPCLAVALAACGGDDDEEGATAAGPDAAEIAWLNSGSKSDSSWTQSWYEGSRQAQEALGDKAEVSYTDNLNSVDALDRAGGAALTEGADALIYGTGEVPDSVTNYAERFPDAFVCDVEPPRETYPDNLCTIYPEFEHGSFLAGALAGLTTKTDHVGVVTGIDIPFQNLQTEAFVLGARYTNPDVEIERVFTQSLTDPAKARAAADAQLGAGADVIFSAVDDAIRGIYAAASEHDGLVIAQYTDQYEDAPDVVLTSVLYRLDQIGAEITDLAASGDLEGKAYSFGLADADVGELAPFRGAPGDAVDQATKDRIAEIEEMIRSGDIEVPDVSVLGTAGAADEIEPGSVEGGAS
jgi:basic membrane protein A and related proteins